MLTICFDDIMLAIKEEEAAKRADGWLSTTIQSLKKASPMSLKISLRSVCFKLALCLQLICSLSKFFDELVFKASIRQLLFLKFQTFIGGLKDMIRHLLPKMGNVFDLIFMHSRRDRLHG